MGFLFSNLTALRWVSRRSSAHGRRFLIGDLTPAALIRASSVEQHNHSWTARRWHIGHSHHAHGHDQREVAGEADGVFRLGLAADVSLAAGKAVTGYLSGSTAIIADAAHSVSDIVLSGVAWLSYRAAMVPKDKEHPYGHGKYETLGALGISSMLLVTAGGIAWHALDVLQGLLLSSPDTINHSLEHGHHNHGNGVHHHGVDLDHPVLALSMVTASIAVKEGLYWITKKASEQQGSGLMKANAWHHRSDAVSSVVALIGVGGTIMGVPILDPLAGLIVSGMIWKAGFETGYESVAELVDAGVDQTVLEPFKQTILQVEGVKGCHRLRGRRAGSYLYLDVHIEVDPFLSVSAAHDIGEMVRYQIQKHHSQVAEVFIHIDPSYAHCSSLLDHGKDLKSGQQKLNIISMQQEAETIISNMLSTLFTEKMSLERITLHTLRGKVFAEVHAQVQVSMPPDMLIRDAIDIAKEAEKEFLKAMPTINHVRIQLRLACPKEIR